MSSTTIMIGKVAAYTATTYAAHSLIKFSLGSYCSEDTKKNHAFAIDTISLVGAIVAGAGAGHAFVKCFTAVPLSTPIAPQVLAKLEEATAKTEQVKAQLINTFKGLIIEAGKCKNIAHECIKDLWNYSKETQEVLIHEKLTLFQTTMNDWQVVMEKMKAFIDENRLPSITQAAIKAFYKINKNFESGQKHLKFFTDLFSKATD